MATPRSRSRPQPAGPGRAADAPAGSPGPSPCQRLPGTVTTLPVTARFPRVTRTLRPPNPAACSTAIATRTAFRYEPAHQVAQHDRHPRRDARRQRQDLLSARGVRELALRPCG